MTQGVCGCEHSSHGLPGITSQSGPAFDSLSLSSLGKGTRPLAGTVFLSQRHKHEPKTVPGASGCGESWGKDWAIIGFEPCLPSSVWQRESTHYISILWVNEQGMSPKVKKIFNLNSSHPNVFLLSKVSSSLEYTRLSRMFPRLA